MIAVSQDSCDNQRPQHRDRAIAFTPQSRAQPVPQACNSAETVADCSVPFASAFGPWNGADYGWDSEFSNFASHCFICASPLAFSRTVSLVAGGFCSLSTCRPCFDRQGPLLSCVGPAQFKPAPGHVEPSTVQGWIAKPWELGLGIADKDRFLGSGLWCACCHVPLAEQASWAAVLLSPLCPHCSPKRSSRLLLQARSFLDPYVLSGQPCAQDS